MSEPILITTENRYKIRILTPSDYDNMVRVIVKPYLLTIFNISFWTGLRYAELTRLYDHPGWIMTQRKSIHLDSTGQRKVKRKARERHVPIPAQIEAEFKYFFTNPKPPCLQTWDMDLKRWAINAGLGYEGITAKMTRATIETWMVTAGLDDRSICLRQGHTSITSLNYYQALPALFSEAERMEIVKRLAGWR